MYRVVQPQRCRTEIVLLERVRQVRSAMPRAWCYVPTPREVRLGVLAVAALGALVFFLLVVGSLGGTRPEVDPLTVESDAPARVSAISYQSSRYIVLAAAPYD